MEMSSSHGKGGTVEKRYRFQCDCYEPSDAMDISVEMGAYEKKIIIITMNFVGGCFWGRLRYAWEIIWGKWTWREFVVREEDEKMLSDIFNPRKKLR